MLMFCLISLGLFVLCLAAIPHLGAGIGALETASSSIDWAQLSRFYLKTEAESNLRNVVF
jgi:hypothetical protein